MADRNKKDAEMIGDEPQDVLIKETIPLPLGPKPIHLVCPFCHTLVGIPNHYLHLRNPVSFRVSGPDQD